VQLYNGENMELPIVGIHGVFSVQRLVDFVKTAVALGCSTVVVSKAVGAAAQNGVPEAQKVVFKSGRNMLVVADLVDIKELLNPDKLILITTEKREDLPEIVFEEIIEMLKENKNIVLVYSGTDTGFTRGELELGEAYRIPLVEGAPLSPVAALAISIFEIKRLQQR